MAKASSSTSALARVPRAPEMDVRTSRVAVAQVTGAQLEAIRTVITHPKSRPDAIITAAAILSSIGTFLGVIKGAKGIYDKVDTALLVVAGVSLCLVVIAYLKNKYEEDPHKANALRHIDALMQKEAETQAELAAAYEREGKRAAKRALARERAQAAQEANDP